MPVHPLAALSSLASAPSKSLLTALLSRTYLHLPTLSPSSYPPPSVTELMSELSLTANQMEDLWSALLLFLGEVLYSHSESSGTAGKVTQALTEGGVDGRVVTLLSTLVPQLCDGWRQASIDSKPSPPTLTSLDWRVSLPRNSAGASAVFQINTTDRGQEGRVVFEMGRAGLETFLDGLEKIKGQLSKVV